MGDGHFGSTEGFLGNPTGGSPPSNYFQDDFLFGLAYADQNHDLFNPAPAEAHEKEEVGATSSDPMVQNQSKRKRSAAGVAFENDDPRERKKLSDKRYREKVKTEKEKMKQQLDELKWEKGSLMHEIGHLRGENAMMSQTLESGTENMRQLSTSHTHLKREFTRQESFVQALLSKLAPGSDMMKQKQESEKQRLKQTLLSKDLKEVVQILEELLNENMKLKREKMILEVKVEALCQKIHNDKHLN